VELSRDDVLAVVGPAPRSVGALGLAVAERAGAATGGEQQPVGPRLAAAGLSLSALQKLVDAMVTEQLVAEVRGKDLWDRGLPTAGTKAMGRYYLSVES
jgi:hypothetical protein